MAVLLLVTAGVAGSTATQSETFRTAVDLGNGVHFNVIASPSHPLFGRFAFGQLGSGVFWASGATVTNNPDGSVDVTYVGSGLRDSAADVDVYLGLHRYSGNEASLPLDLSIHLDATDGSGSGRLIADGVTYVLDPVAQPPSAAPEAQAALALIEASDWSGLYAHLLPATQEAMTEAEFVAAMNQGISQSGSIVDVRPTGLVTEYDQGAWHAAAQPFDIDLDIGGQITTQTSRLVLLYVMGEWRVYSIDALAAPPPDTTPPTTLAGPVDATYESPTVDVPYAASDVGSGVDHVELWSRYRPSGGDPWGVWTLGPTAASSPITYTFSSDGFYEFYTIAVDGAGNREEAPASADAATQKVPASGWSPTETVNDVLASIQLTPAVVLGPDGAAHAVWRDGRPGGSGYDIYYSRRDPSTGTWSANERVNNVTTGNQDEPALAVDSANNVYVVWNDRRIADDADIFFSKRPAATGTWSASVRVNDDGAGKRQDFPSIALTPSGDAIAVWRDQRGGGTKYNTYSSRLPAGTSTWATNRIVTDNANAVKQQVEVAVGSDGVAYAVWHDQRSGNADIWFSTLAAGGTTWAANTKVSDDPGSATQTLPDIGVDASGNLIVVWEDARSSPTQIRARKRPAGGSWTASTVVAAADSHEPAIAVRGDGTAYVAWHDGPFLVGSSQTVWGSEYDVGTAAWSTPEQLSDLGSGTAAGRASVAFDAAQVVVLFDGGPLTSQTYDADILARRRDL